MRKLSQNKYININILYYKMNGRRHCSIKKEIPNSVGTPPMTPPGPQSPSIHMRSPLLLGSLVLPLHFLTLPTFLFLLQNFPYFTKSSSFSVYFVGQIIFQFYIFIRLNHSN